jgi:hypothetical protein
MIKKNILFKGVMSRYLVSHKIELQLIQTSICGSVGSG